MINYMKKTILKNKNKGFTLLETLVAIFILTLSITGPIYIASVAFRNTIDSRDNITAQYIAEEVIEVVRNRRDEKSLAITQAPGSWLTGLTDSATCVNDAGAVDNKCTMEKDGVDYIFAQCSGPCNPISFDPIGSGIVYGKVGVSTFSKFTREFYFQKGTASMADNEITVVVNIRWQDRGRDKLYTLNERLYNVNYNEFFTQ